MRNHVLKAKTWIGPALALLGMAFSGCATAPRPKEAPIPMMTRIIPRPISTIPRTTNTIPKPLRPEILPTHLPLPSSSQKIMRKARMRRKPTGRRGIKNGRMIKGRRKIKGRLAALPKSNP